MLFIMVIFFVFTKGIRSNETYSDIRRVIDGEKATDYPFVVSIVCVKDCPEKLKQVIPMIDEQFTTLRACSGSLIADNWILTASHCVSDVNKKIDTAVVRYGDLTVPHENSTFTYILKSFRHPRYRMNGDSFMANDVGLIKVEPVPMETFGKLSTVDYKSLIGRTVQFVGSGMTMTDEVFLYYPATAREIMKKDQVRPLQMGEAIIVRCERIEYIDCKCPLICLRPKCTRQSQRTQRADSGGPLLYRGKIIGVANAITPMGTVRYMAVEPYSDWIKNVMSTE